MPFSTFDAEGSPFIIPWDAIALSKEKRICTRRGENKP